MLGVLAAVAIDVVTLLPQTSQCCTPSQHDVAMTPMVEHIMGNTQHIGVIY